MQSRSSIDIPSILDEIITKVGTTQTNYHDTHSIFTRWHLATPLKQLHQQLTSIQLEETTSKADQLKQLKQMLTVITDFLIEHSDQKQHRAYKQLFDIVRTTLTNPMLTNLLPEAERLTPNQSDAYSAEVLHEMQRCTSSLALPSKPLTPEEAYKDKWCVDHANYPFWNNLVSECLASFKKGDIHNSYKLASEIHTRFGYHPISSTGFATNASSVEVAIADIKRLKNELDIMTTDNIVKLLTDAMYHYYLHENYHVKAENINKKHLLPLLRAVLAINDIYQISDDPNEIITELKEKNMQLASHKIDDDYFEVAEFTLTNNIHHIECNIGNLATLHCQYQSSGHLELTPKPAPTPLASPNAQNQSTPPASTQSASLR